MLQKIGIFLAILVILTSHDVPANINNHTPDPWDWIGPDRMFVRLLVHAEELELAEDQLPQLEEKREVYQCQYLNIFAEVCKNQKQIRKELGRREPDKKVLSAYVEQEAALFKKAAKLYIDMCISVGDILTAKQVQNLIDIFTEEWKPYTTEIAPDIRKAGTPYEAALSKNWYRESLPKIRWFVEGDVFSTAIIFAETLSITDCQLSQLKLIRADHLHKYMECHAKGAILKTELSHILKFVAYPEIWDKKYARPTPDLAYKMLNEASELFKQSELSYISAILKGKKILSEAQVKHLRRMRRKIVKVYEQAIQGRLPKSSKRAKSPRNQRQLKP